MAHFSASAYRHQRNDAQISRHFRALLRIPRATPTQRSATSFGANRCKRVHRSRRGSSVKLAVTPVRKLNVHLWDREPHEHYVEEQWCSRRLFEVEAIEGGVWDPACGWGRICESARAAGHEVKYSDIIDRGYDPQGRKIIRDFLEPNWPAVDNIVTRANKIDRRTAE